jgi:hypothetical protein
VLIDSNAAEIAALNKRRADDAEIVAEVPRDWNSAAEFSGRRRDGLVSKERPVKAKPKPAAELRSMIKEARREIAKVPGQLKQAGMSARLDAAEKRLGLRKP